jgi:hypothetical protein
MPCPAFRRSLAVIAAFAPLAIAIGELPAFAEEAPATSQESEQTSRLIQAELPSWKLWSGDDKKRELKLDPKPALRYTNPATVRVYGDVFLWTRDGRPEAIMSLFKVWEPPRGFHVEWHSLSPTNITAERNGQLFWNSTRPGVEFVDIPGAPPPAASALARLAQVRRLAKAFSADLSNENGQHALRLLPQPIYRYPSENAAMLDGAIFALVLGTDPEAFLLIEARKTHDDTRWQYAVARMNDRVIDVHYQGRKVWRAEEATERDALRDPYCMVGLPEAP